MSAGDRRGEDPNQAGNRPLAGEKDAHMPAYMVLQIEVHDADGFDRYRELAAPTIGQHGGKVLASDSEPDLIEGPGPARRTVVVEFPTKEAARGWYDSPEYQRALEVRLAASSAVGVLAEGR